MRQARNVRNRAFSPVISPSKGSESALRCFLLTEYFRLGSTLSPAVQRPRLGSPPLLPRMRLLLAAVGREFAASMID